MISKSLEISAGVSPLKTNKWWVRLRLIAASSWLEWLLLGLTLLPFILVSAYNHPTDDDFQGAVLARRLGLWESVGFYYQKWTGRYTSSFLYGLVYEMPDLRSWLWALRIAPVLFLTGLLTGAWFALGGLATQLRTVEKWRVAIYGVVLYLHGMPLVVTALYWYNGAAVYTSGLVLTLVLVGTVGRYSRASASRPRAVWGGLSAVVAFLLVGTNELSMMTTLVGLVLWVYFVPANQKRWPLMLLGVAAAGALLTVIAPGNTARAATIITTDSIAHRLFITASKVIYLAGNHAVGWSSSGVLLIATIGFLLAPVRTPRQSQSYWLLVAAGAGVLLLFLLIVPSIWLTNDVPSRVWNVVYFVFLLSWFSVAWWLAALPKLVDFRARTAAWQRNIRVLLLLLLLGSQYSHIQQAYIDLAFKAAPYDRAQQNRYRTLQQLRQRGRPEAVVAPLFPNEYQYPPTIFLHGLEAFPQDIANQGMAAYFGLDSVRVGVLPARVRRHFHE